MRVALFGDSQAEGLAPHLREDLELVFVAARRGLSTARFLDEVPWADAEAQDPDLLLVVLGGNDFDGRNYLSTLEHAVDRFSDVCSNIVWIGPSASSDREVAARHDAVRARQAQVLPRLGVTFLDPRAWQIGAAGRHAPDGTHFTSAAYALQSQAIAERLRFRPPWGWIAAGVAVSVGLGLTLALR